MHNCKCWAHITKSLSLPGQEMHSPLRPQIADHTQTTCSRKASVRPDLSCRARYSDSEELRKEKKALEALLKTSSEAEGDAKAAEERSTQPAIRDLPLWRIQSATLPGSQAMYHVHVPHYAAMFGELLDGPKPQRFGHIYLPGGSVNLSNPAYELRPGTSAPLIGTLMEVVSHLWLEDGRLLILAVGLCRIKVVKQRQGVPHSRADVEVLPDVEEVQERLEVAMKAVDACSGSSEAPLSVITQAAGAAAIAAASAATLAWCDYEVVKLRELSRAQGQKQPPEGASPVARQMFDKSKLVWRHILASLNGLKSGLKLGVNVGQDEVAGLPHLTDSGDRTEASRQLVEASSEAEEAAGHAASAAAALSLGQSMPSTEGLLRSEQGPLNTVVERGIPCKGPSTSLDDRPAVAEPSLNAMPQACADALTAERQVWRLHSELSELALLTHRLFSAPKVLLPQGVMQLDPRSSSSSHSTRTSASQSSATSASPELDLGRAEGGSSSTEVAQGGNRSAAPAQPLAAAQRGEQGVSQVGTVAEVSQAGRENAAAYPTLARAKRLSYCMATALPGKFGEAEGRQAILEAGSIAARLHLIVEVLQERKDQLSTLHTLEQSFSKEGQQEDN